MLRRGYQRLFGAGARFASSAATEVGASSSEGFRYALFIILFARDAHVYPL